MSATEKKSTGFELGEVSTTSLSDTSAIDALVAGTIKDIEQKNTQSLKIGMRLNIVEIGSATNKKAADDKKDDKISFMNIKFAPANGFNVDNTFTGNLFFSTLLRKATVKDLGYTGSTIDGKQITAQAIGEYLKDANRKDLIIKAILLQEDAEFDAAVLAAADADFTPKRTKVYQFVTA